MNTFMKPSEAPSTDGYKFSTEENIGALFIIWPKAEDEMENTYQPGKMSQYIISDVAEIDLENVEDTEYHEDVWIFPAWIRGAIRSSIADGGMVLGRLEQDATKGKGKNAAWVLEDPDEEDIEAAQAYLQFRNTPKTASEGAGKEKTKKKGKK